MLDQLRRRSSHPHQVWGIHALSRKCFVALEAQRKICYKSSTQKLVCIWRARPEVFANCIKVEIEWISLQTVSTDCVASSCPHLGQIRCRFRMPCIEPWHIIKHGWKRPCIKRPLPVTISRSFLLQCLRQRHRRCHRLKALAFNYRFCHQKWASSMSRKYGLKWLGGLGDKSVLGLSCLKSKIWASSLNATI